MSKVQRYGLLGAAAVIAVVAFVLLSPGGDDTAESPTQPAGLEEPSATPPVTEPQAEARPQEEPSPEPGSEEIVVRDGEPVGGVRTISVKAGEQVRLAVTSDAPDEVHVHGYDLTEDVTPGQAARLRFPADLEGVFEVELEESHVQVAELEVEPR